MWGADTLKWRPSRWIGESMKASSGFRCASGRKALRAHTFIALVTLSLQHAHHTQHQLSKPSDAAPPRHEGSSGDRLREMRDFMDTKTGVCQHVGLFAGSYGGGVKLAAGAHELRTPTRRRLETSSSLEPLARSPMTARPAIMRRNWCRGTRSLARLPRYRMGLFCKRRSSQPSQAVRVGAVGYQPRASRSAVRAQACRA